MSVCVSQLKATLLTAHAGNKCLVIVKCWKKGMNPMKFSVRINPPLSFTDFNEDDYICENDLKKVIQRLCGEQRLSDENVNALIQKVIS